MSRDVFVPTSVARGLIARMRATHERRRIGIFSGPPGIGKTTAIDAFRSQHPDAVAVVKAARQNAREVLVLQHVLESLRRLGNSPAQHAPSNVWDLRNALFGAICHWAGAEPIQAKKGEYEAEAFGKLTIVFDEAQNLSRQAIEALRYWNDRDRCYAPFPVGLVFVGNNEFSLQADSTGESAISAAVADRALHVQRLEYGDLVDADIEMFVEARGVTERSAIGAILRYLRSSRSPRSLRRVADLLDDVIDQSAGRPITGEVVQAALVDNSPL